MALPIPEGDYFIFTRCAYPNSRALDVPIGNPDKSLDDNTFIQVYEYMNGQDNQKWHIKPIRNNVYTIVNVKSQKTLDVPNALTTPARLQQFHYFNGDDAHQNQLWSF